MFDLRFSQNMLFPDYAARDKFFDQVRRSEQVFKDKYKGKPLRKLAPLASLSKTLLGGFIPIKDHISEKDRKFEDHVLISRTYEEVKPSVKSEYFNLAHIEIADLEAEKKHEDRYTALRFTHTVIGIGAYFGVAQDTAGNFVIVAFYAHNTGKFNQDYFAQTKDAIFIIREPNVTGFGLIDNEGRNINDWPAIIRVDHLTDVVVVKDGSWDKKVPVAWTPPNVVSGTDLTKWSEGELLRSARDMRLQGYTHEALRRIDHLIERTKLFKNLNGEVDPEQSVYTNILTVKADILLALNMVDLYEEYTMHFIHRPEMDSNSEYIELYHHVRCMLLLYHTRADEALAAANRLTSIKSCDDQPLDEYYDLIKHCKSASSLYTKAVQWHWVEDTMCKYPDYPLRPDLPYMKMEPDDEGVTIAKAHRNVEAGELLAIDSATVFRYGMTSKRMFYEVVPSRKVIYPESRVLARNAWLQYLYRNKMSAETELVSLLRICGEKEEKLNARKILNGIKVDGRLALDTNLIDSFMDKKISFPTKLERTQVRTSASPRYTFEQIASHGTAIFPLAGTIQHSCTPNAVWAVFGTIARLQATRPISRDEPITVNTLGEEFEFTERKRALLLQTGKRCKCEFCKLENGDEKGEKKKIAAAELQGKIWLGQRKLRDQKFQQLLNYQLPLMTSERALKVFYDFFVGPQAFQLYTRPATEQPRIGWSRVYEFLVEQLTIQPDDVDTITPFLANGPGKFQSMLNLKLHFLVLAFEVLLGVRGFTLDENGILKWGLMHPVFFHLTKKYSDLHINSPELFADREATMHAWRQMTEVSKRCLGWGLKGENLFELQEYMQERGVVVDEPESIPVTMEWANKEKWLRTRVIVDLQIPGFGRNWQEEFEQLTEDEKNAIGLSNKMITENEEVKGTLTLSINLGSRSYLLTELQVK